LIGGGGGGKEDKWGGGGGAFAEGTAVIVVPTTPYAVVIGAGGVAGADGGDTTFNVVTVVAKGGQGGELGNAGGQAAACTGDIKWSGGTGHGFGGAGPGGGSAGYSSAGDPVVGTAIPGLPDGTYGGWIVLGAIPGAGGGKNNFNSEPGGSGICQVIYDDGITEGFPDVPTRSQGKGSVTGTVCLMPTGIQADELLILIVGITTAPTITVPGWSSIGSQNYAADTHKLEVFTKVATGGDTATITLSVTPNPHWYVIYRVSTSDAGSIQITFATNAGDMGDPPVHTPSGGSGKYLWICGSSWIDPGAAVVTALPTGFESLWRGIPWGNDAAITQVGQCADRLFEGATLNPTAFTGSVGRNCVTFTLSLSGPGGWTNPTNPFPTPVLTIPVPGVGRGKGKGHAKGAGHGKGAVDKGKAAGGVTGGGAVGGLGKIK